MIMKLTEYDEDIPSFYVEVDYIIVVRHHVMSQQLSSSNCRQLGIATDPSVATYNSIDAFEPMNRLNNRYIMQQLSTSIGTYRSYLTSKVPVGTTAAVARPPYMPE